MAFGGRTEEGGLNVRWKGVSGIRWVTKPFCCASTYRFAWSINL